MFAVTLLGVAIGSVRLVAMMIPGAANVVIAYALEKEIAGTGRKTGRQLGHF